MIKSFRLLQFSTLMILATSCTLVSSPVGKDGSPVRGTALTVTASRVTGVAPLSVFFDTTSSPRFSDGSYIDATCLWNFGDTVSNPAYRTGNGFVAAHVFEAPGNYTVTVDVYDRGTEHTSQQVTVHVAPFDGQTYYVAQAPTGDDTADGSQAHPFATVGHAMGLIQPPPATNNLRILFRKGDTFETGASIQSTTLGPVILGSYGLAGPKPILHTSLVNDAFGILFMGHDWRVMDLAFTSDGNTSVGTTYPGGVYFGGNDSLLFRVDEYHLGNFLLSVSGHRNTQAECVVHDFSRGGYSAVNDTYGSNDSLALIGNQEYDVTNDSAQHGFRLQGGTRVYLAGNDFNNLNPNFDNVTIRGNSDRVVVYKNIIHGHMTILPQNREDLPVEHQNHILVDSNLFLSTPAFHGTAISLQSQDIVIRNNVFSNYELQVAIQKNGRSGDSARVQVINNTALGNDWDYFGFAYVDAVCRGTRLTNNLLLDSSAKNNYQRSFLVNQGAPNLLAGASDFNGYFGMTWPAGKDNVFPWQDPAHFAGGSLSAWRAGTGQDSHTVNADPLLLSIDPAQAGFAKLDPSSPMKKAGTPTGAYLDYFGTVRDPSLPSVGAFEVP